MQTLGMAAPTSNMAMATRMALDMAGRCMVGKVVKAVVATAMARLPGMVKADFFMLASEFTWPQLNFEGYGYDPRAYGGGGSRARSGMCLPVP